MRTTEQRAPHLTNQKRQVDGTEDISDAAQRFPKQVTSLLRLATESLAKYGEQLGDLRVAESEREVLSDLNDADRNGYSQAVLSRRASLSTG